MQGHYVHPDDCAAGTQNNNASYREVKVEQSVTTGFWSLITRTDWRTQRGQPAVLVGGDEAGDHGDAAQASEGASNAG